MDIEKVFEMPDRKLNMLISSSILAESPGMTPQIP